MIRCKRCGEINPHYKLKCPRCSALPEITEKEERDLIREAEEMLSYRDYIRAVDIYKLLAQAGSAIGERELGLILEKGILLPRNYEVAVQYYFSAATKGDVVAAYKHSRTLVGNDALADFWLAYAAIMEYKEAYPDAVALYAKYKERTTAAYYCAQLAKDGDVDGLTEMARRHLYGDGVEQSEGQARWYADKIERAPLHALKLYRRVSAIEARPVEPKIPEFTERLRVIERLIAGARRFRLPKIELALAELYASVAMESGPVFLARMHIEGVEFAQNIELGIDMLDSASQDGSVIGARMLGDLYSEGKYVDKDTDRAISYYRRAAELGAVGEWEVLGDVFHDGSITPPEYALALSLYEAGADRGDYGCQRKLKMMHAEREKHYIEATGLERTDPDQAFILFKRSVDAGYLPAHARIGRYYERGIGTKADRRAAFRHYLTAYESGDKRAIESLGRCYARGIGTEFNFRRASELLGAAREMGSHSADRELYRIYENKKRHMIRSLYSTATRLYFNKKYDLAREMYEVCMQLGLGEATYSIGCLYEFGITTDPDRKTALRYYKKAFEQGYTDERQYHKQSMLRIWKR